MKTLISLSFALALFTLTLSLQASTPPPITQLDDEAYIDDIPFSTEKIYDSLFHAELTHNFVLEEDSYINDIPFNTEEIVFTDQISKLNLKMEDEPYINDIPDFVVKLADL